MVHAEDMESKSQTHREAPAIRGLATGSETSGQAVADWPRNWLEQTRPASPAQLVVPMAPSGVFLAVNALAGLIPAIVVASAVSGVLVVLRRRQGRQVGFVLPVMLAYVATRGIAAVLTESHEVFFGFGLVLSTTFALAVLASGFSTSPAAAHAIPLIANYQPHTVAHPVYLQVARHVSITWALCEMAVTGWEASHLRNATAAEFIGIHALVGWPAMAFVVFCLIFYVRFRLDILDRQSADSPPTGEASR